MFTKIMWSILLIGGGFLILKYRAQVKHFVGEFAWAEVYLGRGSTYLVLMLIACAMIFLGFVIPFGKLDFLFNN